LYKILSQRDSYKREIIIHYTTRIVDDKDVVLYNRMGMYIQCTICVRPIKTCKGRQTLKNVEH